MVERHIRRNPYRWLNGVNKGGDGTLRNEVDLQARIGEWCIVQKTEYSLSPFPAASAGDFRQRPAAVASNNVFNSLHHLNRVTDAATILR